MYGLKNAALVWYDLLLSQFNDLGFRALKNAPCIFKRADMLITLYVDDLIVFSRTNDEIDERIGSLSKTLKLKDLGVPSNLSE